MDHHFDKLDVAITMCGHTSMETAYAIPDYPYSFTLRCEARAWIERKKNFGERFMFQTKNPKNGIWNKPRAGTYSTLHAMYLDSQGHLQNAGWTPYLGAEGLAAFRERFSLSLEQQELAGAIQERYRAMEARKAATAATTGV
jgi:hypothetical protein